MIIVKRPVATPLSLPDIAPRSSRRIADSCALGSVASATHDNGVARLPALLGDAAV